MKNFTYTIGLIACFCSVAIAQDKPENVKTGYNFGALPAISFDSDRGFQYGALVNIFDYGDGSKFPGYDHSLYLESSWYTKGSQLLRLYYDSEKLIGNNIRLTADVTYSADQAIDFFGFNGYESLYNPDFETQNNSNYKSRMFYKYDNNMFRFKLDLQQQIADSKFKWLAGFSLYNYTTKTANIAKLNEGKSGADLLPNTDLLYDKYVNWGIIDNQQKNGGLNSYLRAGLVFDTRNNKAFPSSGMWTEAIVRYAPSFLGDKTTSHSRLAFIHRQYFTLIKNKMVFAYRINIDQLLGGKVPFYLLPNMDASYLSSSITDGLGGSTTLRGIRRNRVVGNGVAMANVELRYKMIYFKFIKQQFYIGTNLFFDSGMVIDAYDTDLSTVSIGDRDAYFSTQKEKLHSSFGGGLKIAMNENFIISAEYGKALDKRDGNSGMYIKLNYLF